MPTTFMHPPATSQPMRTPPAVAPPLLLSALLLLAVPADAAGFGHGDVAFAEHAVPGAESAPEPTLGIPWTTDEVFFHALSTTLRGTFDGAGKPTWVDVTAAYQVPQNLDPMLHADPDVGRVWAGGLAGPCSVMLWSDDSGETWVPTGNMCSGVRFDHQSIGSGPPAEGSPNVVFPHNVYYCGQLDAIACTVSFDGGESFLPFQDVPGACGGFHGHIRVSRASGLMAVPVPGCGEMGFISTADNGLTYQSNTIKDTEEWSNGFDPSLQFSRPSGWMYYGQASEHGVHVALTKDEGRTWEPLGGGMGVEPTHWLDVGRFHDPPVLVGTFADVQAGDDERAAFSFLGIEQTPGADIDWLHSNQIYQCDERQDELVWHYYVAITYDAGQTWNVTRISDDPVQVGGIYDSVVGGSGSCRNLLDFNDMDIDSEGRIHIGFADGCVRECAETGEPDTDGYRQRVGKIYRQSEGQGLFAQSDTGAHAVEATQPEPPAGDEEVPAAGLLLALAAVGAALLLRRR